MKSKKATRFAPTAWTCVIIIVAVSIVTAIALPILPVEYQGAVGSTVGSIVGTLLAFLGALFIWVRDQKSIQVRDNLATDKKLLRDSYVEISVLEALRNESTKDTEVRQRKRLAIINVTGYAALIGDQDLREECEFIANFVRDDEYLDFSMPRLNRPYIGQVWLQRLYALPEGASLHGVRPAQYDKIKEALEEIDEYVQMNIEAQEEWRQERDEEARNKARE